MKQLVLMFLKNFLDDWNGALQRVIFSLGKARFRHTTPCFNSFVLLK
jgi:hypothetical protein